MVNDNFNWVRDRQEQLMINELDLYPPTGKQTQGLPQSIEEALQSFPNLNK